MSEKETARKIFEVFEEKENIVSNTACMTRLRIKPKESFKVDTARLRNIENVKGVVENNGTVQIVLGPGTVNRVAGEFVKLSGIPLGESAQDTADEVGRIAKENKDIIKKRNSGAIQHFLQKIGNIFVPLLPGIIAAGLISGIIKIIEASAESQVNAVWWLAAVKSVSFAVFAYLPVYVGINSAKEFGGTAILGGIIGSLFAVNPLLPLISGTSGGAIILPLTDRPFEAGIGGLLAALFMGMITGYLEKTVRKFIPSMLDTFLTPLVTLLASMFIAILLIQPVGTALTGYIYAAVDFSYNRLGILGGYILSAGFLPLVSLGLHHALTPIHILLNNPDGATGGVNYLLPILMMAGGGQVGAGFAIYLKTENRKLKKLIRDSLPAGILGIGEPLMYGVTLPLGKPFITACLGAGFGGVLSSLFHIGAISQGVSGLLGLLIVVPGTWLFFLTAMLASYMGGFILTYFFGVDEERINTVYKN